MCANFYAGSAVYAAEINNILLYLEVYFFLDLIRHKLLFFLYFIIDVYSMFAELHIDNFMY